jgi:ATP-dependent DNA ligase
LFQKIIGTSTAEYFHAKYPKWEVDQIAKRLIAVAAKNALQYSDHQIGRGPEFYARACELSLEGIISKRANAPYASGNRGLWVKVKCLNREEFVVVGWTDPEGSRPRLGDTLCWRITHQTADWSMPVAPE